MAKEIEVVLPEMTVEVVTPPESYAMPTISGGATAVSPITMM